MPRDIHAFRGVGAVEYIAGNLYILDKNKNLINEMFNIKLINLKINGKTYRKPLIIKEEFKTPKICYLEKISNSKINLICKNGGG